MDETRNEQAEEQHSGGMDGRSAGYLMALAAAALWASSGTLAKYLFNGGVSPADLVSMRLWLAALLALAYNALWSPKRLAITRRQLFQLFLLGSLGMALVNFTYFLAISQTNVATAIFLQYTAPVLVAVWGLATREEPPSWPSFAALVLAMSGLFLLATGGSITRLQVNPLGLAAGLMAAVFFAFYTVYSRKRVSHLDSVTVLTYALLSGAVFWSFFHPPTVLLGLQLGFDQVLMVAYISTFGTLLPFGLYNLSLIRLPATHSVTTATTEPVISLGLAYVLLREMLLLSQVFGGLLIIGSVLALSLGATLLKNVPALQSRLKGAGKDL